MNRNTAMKAIRTAYNHLKAIETAADLKREKLTFAEYEAAKDCFKDLSSIHGTAKTFIKAVADFYSRAGYIVTPGAVNYTITLKNKATSA